MSLKNELLQFFALHPEETWSGEYLADSFGVTRAAVWKSIRQLKQEGFAITSLGGQGYVFSSGNDFLNKEMIYAAAGQNDFNLILLDTVDSTNNYARKAVVDHIEDGTMIVANEQTGGRGRNGHSFYSPANTGLYISYVYRPEDPRENLSQLTACAAVAVCEAIAACTSVKPEIKWLNDIYVNDRKIAGILTEVTGDFETRSVESVIIGIGINCRHTACPDELNGIMGAIDDPSLSRSRLAGILYTKLKEKIRHRNTPDLLKQYISLSFLIGRTIHFIHDGTEQTGTVTDIDDHFNLVIKTEGRETHFSASDIHLLSW